MYFISIKDRSHHICARVLRLGLVGKHLLDGLGRERLGPLQGHTESSVPDELSGHTESSRDTEEDGVVVLLGESVGVQQDSGMRVDVGPRVLGLSSLQQDVGRNLVDLGDELEELVIRDVLERKLPLRSVSGVGLSQDGVTVSGNDTGLQGLPTVLLDLGVGGVLSDLGLHLLDPPQDLLVGKTVQGTGETERLAAGSAAGRRVFLMSAYLPVQGSGVRKEGVRQGGTDQVTGVGLAI
jgi:hypothetical protein